MLKPLKIAIFTLKIIILGMNKHHYGPHPKPVSRKFKGIDRKLI